MSFGSYSELHGSGQSNAWCGSGKDAHAQNGASGLRLSRSQAMVRSAIQELLCQATGSPEDHVCAAPVPGRVSCAHSLRPSSFTPRAISQRS
jgi:hypothetical protein